jgi:hypothetical protein
MEKIRMSITLEQKPKAALERLIAVAHGHTGQSRSVANFLLAWWDASTFGGFDITDAWACDDGIVADIISVFRIAALCNRYPDSLGYESEFQRIVHNWHPQFR